MTFFRKCPQHLEIQPDPQKRFAAIFQYVPLGLPSRTQLWAGPFTLCVVAQLSLGGGGEKSCMEWGSNLRPSAQPMR